jgi:hypothetical protein
MPPKNKGKAKASTTDDTSTSKSKGLKPATAINVRHILCEKHSKKEEAMEKLRNGAKFDEVAREMSEDKARQGMLHPPSYTTTGAFEGIFSDVILSQPEGLLVFSSCYYMASEQWYYGV